ncbi:MAG: hypothetical protein QF580_02380 [Gammaproteobacteria bacterium]|nr:hypothetical protein [Gammaproteobacteria bacterium]
MKYAGSPGYFTSLPAAATDAPASSALCSVACPRRIAEDTSAEGSVARLEFAGTFATSLRKLVKYPG